MFCCFVPGQASIWDCSRNMVLNEFPFLSVCFCFVFLVLGFFALLLFNPAETLDLP